MDGVSSLCTVDSVQHFTHFSYILSLYPYLFVVSHTRGLYRRSTVLFMRLCRDIAQVLKTPRSVVGAVLVEGGGGGQTTG